MIEYLVADSYKNATFLSEPFKKDGKQYIQARVTCKRCGGSGHYSYNQMDGTMCYGCHGTGYQRATIRVYTEKEYATMQRAKQRAAERKEETRKAKEEDNIANAAVYKKEIAMKLGFNENEETYLIVGEDTYSIKNILKENGAKFSPVLKWYSPQQFPLPEGYSFVLFTFDELYEYHIQTRHASEREDVRDIINSKIRQDEISEYYPAAEKTRLHNITAIFTHRTSFDGTYGTSFVYTFKSENYVFVWFTSKPLGSNFVVGDTVDLTGTIKGFNEYDGIKQTCLNRCVVNKIGG